MQNLEYLTVNGISIDMAKQALRWVRVQPAVTVDTIDLSSVNKLGQALLARHSSGANPGAAKSSEDESLAEW